MTLNQVLKRIKLIALSHKQVRNFQQGLVSDFLTDKTTLYPSVFLQDNGGKISTSAHATTLSYKLFFIDLVNLSEETKGNEQDVQSDMLSVAQDIIAQMNNSNYDDWALSVDNNVEFVVEEYGDMVAGCIVDISIRTMFKQNVCEVPSDLTDYVTTDIDMKTVYDIAYIATGTEVTNLSVPEIVGKRILLIAREGGMMHKVSNLPDSAQYTWNDTTIGLGLPTVAGQRFLILYRNY
jgi:hypothetical protein